MVSFTGNTQFLRSPTSQRRTTQIRTTNNPNPGIYTHSYSTIYLSAPTHPTLAGPYFLFSLRFYVSIGIGFLVGVAKSPLCHFSIFPSFSTQIALFLEKNVMPTWLNTLSLHFLPSLFLFQPSGKPSVADLQNPQRLLATVCLQNALDTIILLDRKLKHEVPFSLSLSLSLSLSFLSFLSFLSLMVASSLPSPTRRLFPLSLWTKVFLPYETWWLSSLGTAQTAQKQREYMMLNGF